jgi:hypothetical protein
VIELNVQQASEKFDQTKLTFYVLLISNVAEIAKTNTKLRTRAARINKTPLSINRCRRHLLDLRLHSRRPLSHHESHQFTTPPKILPSFPSVASGQLCSSSLYKIGMFSSSGILASLLRTSKCHCLKSEAGTEFPDPWYCVSKFGSNRMRNVVYTYISNRPLQMRLQIRNHVARI